MIFVKRGPQLIKVKKQRGNLSQYPLFDWKICFLCKEAYMSFTWGNFKNTCLNKVNLGNRVSFELNNILTKIP